MVTRAPSRSWEPLAVRFCKAVHVLAEGKPAQGVSVDRVSQHIKVRDAEMLEGAISHAVQRGWLTVAKKPVPSVLLTEAGELVAVRKSGHSNAPGMAKQAPVGRRKR